MLTMIVLLHILGCAVVGVHSNVGDSECTILVRFPLECLHLPNSYCDISTGVCVCLSGYVDDGREVACIYDCGAPGAPANGEVDTSSGTTTNSVVIFSCDNGYKLNGARTSTCVADTGWDNTAATCVPEIDECDANPCQNGGTCTAAVAVYSCSCVAGYAGTNCETDIDDCSPEPCLNGATCDDGVFDYSCTCVAGYEDKNCQTNINECNKNLCENGATCVDGVNQYTCNCVAGYDGTLCENNIDDCSPEPCQNGASCVDGVDDYSCTCVAGYEDKHCQTNIDECKSNLCQNEATCIDGDDEYACLCVAGYNGTYCADNIDECVTNNCQNGATCVDEIDGYTCVCTSGYEGIFCQNDIDECAHNICQNGSPCVDVIDGYTCVCLNGYDGTYCQNNVNECIDNLCVNGATCVDGIGGYTCTCLAGYQGTYCDIASIGQRCDENTRCGTDKGQCFGNVCVCATGIYNQDDDICDSMLLYPYGEPMETLGNVDDECSTAVTFELGIPIFNEQYTEMFVCSNGLVSLGLPYTNPVPNKDLHYLGNRIVLAAFFSDIETGEFGSVSYKVHNIKIDPDNLSNADVQNVAQILKQNGASDSFDVKFILFSTWHRVKPRRTGFGDTGESTFQLVLASSGIETYVMYIYAHAQMQWTTATLQPDVWVGYVTPGDERYSHPMSFTKDILEMDNNVETNGITGLLLLPLNSAVPAGVTESLECLIWYNDNKHKNEEYKDTVLPECPCDLTALRLDPRFPPHRLETEGVICSTAWPDPRLLPYGMKCCFGTETGLFIRDIPDAGGLLSKHPLVDQKYHILDDIIPKQKCCKDPAYCHFYYDVHPIGTCYSRSWFKFGTFWGDPHFRSLDGLDFTFNGWGEYLMLKVYNFELHARTEPVGEHDGVVSNATVFSAFAAKQNKKTLFHVELNSSKTGLILFGSGIDLTRRFQDSDDEYPPFNFTSIDHLLVLSKWNNTLKVIFTETGISLDISIGVRTLTLNVLAPKTLQDLTSGLLGNFDDSAENDFTTPDGQTHSSDMTEQDIYRYAQQWEISVDGSAFYYDDQMNHTNYQHNDHIPPFLSDVDSDAREEAEELCDINNTACLTDFINAGVEVAMDTQQTDIKSQHDLIEIGKTTPQLRGCDQLFVNPGVQSFCQVSLHDAEVDNVDFSFIGSVNGNGELNNVQFDADTLTISYTHPEGNFEPVQIRLTGANTDGKTSPPLQVFILLCTGCSGNGRCLNESRRDRRETAFTAYAKCECDNGYDGSDCENNVDGCSSEPCSLGRTCTDLSPTEQQLWTKAYTCSGCPPGWTLNEEKCFDIDECNETNGACAQICINTQGGYKCSCHQGYKKNARNESKCDDINECDIEEHNCTDICVNTPGGFICSCHDGYSFNSSSWTCKEERGNDNNACLNMNCSASGGCSIKDGKPTCFCKYGYELDSDGTQCIDIDECNRKVCQQQCVNTVGGFQCSCHPGYRLIDRSKCIGCENSYFGENCANQCECLGRGALACDSVKGCICADGWTADKCDKDINECDIRNVCNDVYKMCRNTPGSFRCDCLPGYEMKRDGTCQDVDECSSPALNSCSQTCLNTVGNYTCGCKEGFISVNDTECGDIDECSLLIDECDQVCDNVPGSYNCFCKFGYKLLSDRKTCLQVEDLCKMLSNLTCEHYCLTSVDDAVCVCRSGYILADDGQHCKDINECVDRSASGEQCSETAICFNTDGSFFCKCPIGTKLENDGRTCSECDKHHYGQNCFNECSCLNGQCDKSKGCICYDGWVGTNCDSEIDPCATGNDLCTAANSVCVNRHGMAHCICMAGYHNTSGHCEDVDECTAVPPYCDQVCNNTVGSYVCDCQNGFQMTDGKCVDIDECQATAACDQICENTAGGYSCSCEDGFKLDLKDRASCFQLEANKCSGALPSYCLNGTCVVTNGQQFCICDKGHEVINDTCKDINECKVSVCDHICTNLVGEFKCSCNKGSYLLQDGRTCKECKNGFYGEQCNKTCDCNINNTDLCDTRNGTCYCKDGWMGITCSADIDECTADVHPCPANSACINTNGTFICHCDTGFVKLASGHCEVCRNGRYGADCREECPCIDEHTVSCNHVDGTCICVEGWNGNCSVDIDECGSTPCTDKLFSECKNYDGSYSCDCPDGYLDVNGQCKDDDECAEGIDECDYICKNINGSYTCLCEVGFGGSWNDCTECSENTYGQNCIKTCDCIRNNAQNQNQTCDKVTGQCLCKDGWTGETCEHDVNECEDEDICVNILHSACHNVKGSHECSCLRGFEYDTNLDCVRKSPEPTNPIDEDIYGRISTSIRIDIWLPAGFNLGTSAGLETVSWTVKKALIGLYSSYTGPELLIVVTNIRLGPSIIANYDIIYNKSDDNIIDELLTVTVDIATGAAVFEYDNQTVSVSSDTFGTNVELCDVYTTLISTCGEGFKCDVVDGSVQCRETSGTTSNDITVLYIGIGAGLGVLLLIMLVAGCVAKFIGDRRRKNRKTRECVNINALSGFSISDGTRNNDQLSYPADGVINAKGEDNRKLTWKSMFGYLSNGDNGPSKPVIKIPRPHVRDIHEPKLV